MSLKPAVVLVHGLWHQPAHFDPLAHILREQGVTVHVPRLHRGSLADDTAAVQQIVDGCAIAPVVVGHSYGGTVITGLNRVSHLIYIAAFVPAEGESSASLGGTDALVNAVVRHNDDGTTSIPMDRARDVLYADCTPAESAWASSLLVSQRPGHGRGVPQRIAWRDTPSTAVICEQDRALSPELQKRMASRCAAMVSLDSGHSPFISQSRKLADLIVSVCNEVETR